MKITFLSTPPNMGGGIKVMSIYADFLAKQGHQVLVVSQPSPQPDIKSKLKSLLKGQLSAFKQTHHKTHFDDYVINHHELDSCRTIIDADLPSADLVIATWWETAEWMYALSPSKGKQVYFVQGHETFDFLPIDRVKATYGAQVPIIVVSQWLKNIMQTEYACQDLFLVPNAYDQGQFFPQARTKQAVPTIGFLTSESTLKGLDLAIEVASELRKKIPDLKIQCFGGHPLSGLLLEGMNKLGVEVEITPTKDRIREIYRACDLWLSCSRTEGFNLTAMEAMACGTPVVCTSTGWPQAAIQQYKNGALAEVDDLDALVEHSAWLLGLSSEDWKIVSNNALDTVKDYAWEKSCAMFEQALLQIHGRA